VAPTDLSVLLTGESGTGKEVAARAIHETSGRRGRFQVVDCSSIPSSLAESTLFGHEKGSFTGAAHQDSPFVIAQGGTVFLDEIGDLPLEIQPKLLRALQEREIKSIGAKQYRKIDVRIIAATLHDLHTDVNDGRFRADLFHRLNQIEIRMPSLRERMEDIPTLVAKLFVEFGDADAVRRIDETSRRRLESYDWPGNVRELRNVLYAAFQLSHGGPIEIGELGTRRNRVAAAKTIRPSLERSYEEQSREHADAFDLPYFTALLRKTAGNVSEMARIAGVDRSTVRERIERLGLRKPDSKDRT
jgi:DNA-binding NtrC family response regulator